MVLARVVNLVGGTQRHSGIDDLILMSDEVDPFLVLGHSNGTFTELAHEVHCVLGLSLENASVGIVGLLDLADDNGLQLPARAFKVEVGLAEC